MDDKKSSAVAQEVDAWWGSCSLRSLVPEAIVFMLASVVVAVPAWLLRDGVVAQLVVGFLLVIWLTLILSWGYRTLGWNYRLTTRRLFKATGLRRRRLEEVALDRVERVVVKRGLLGSLLGVGRVLVERQDSRPLILPGVRGPDQVAEKISALARAARESRTK